VITKFDKIKFNQLKVMKTKLLKYSLLLILFAGIVSCQKETDVVPDAALSSHSNLQEKLLHLTQHYEGEKRQNFNKLFYALEWSKTRQTEIEKGEYVYRIPSTVAGAYSRAGKESRRMLVIHTNSGSGIQEAYVLDVIAENNAVTDERQVATVFGKEQLSQKQLNGFPGERVLYDLGLSLQERHVYKAGRLVQSDKVTRIKTSNPNQVLSAGGTAVNAEHCITWWLSILTVQRRLERNTWV
jgi:hypothetical protein